MVLTQAHEFLPYAGQLNLATNKKQFLASEFQLIKRAELRNKAVGNLRIAIFIQMFVEELAATIKQYQSCLCTANTAELSALEGSVSQMIFYYHTLNIYNDFQHNCADKSLPKKILEKLDEMFLYTNNMKLLVQICECFTEKSRVAETYNWVEMDLSLPATYYFARLEQLYKKYERYFTGELEQVPALKKATSELEMIRGKSSKEDAKSWKKNSSAKDDKQLQQPLSALTLDELLEFKSMTKIAQYLEKGFMSNEDKTALLISLKSLVLKQQYKQNPTLRTDFLMQLYNFFRSGVLNENELALC